MAIKLKKLNATFFYLCAFSLLGAIDDTQAGKLRRAGEAVQTRDNDPPCNRSRRDNCDDDSDSFTGELIGELISGVFCAIFDRDDDHCHRRHDVTYQLNTQEFGEPYPVVPAAFTAYPYENGHPGNMDDYSNVDVRQRTTSKRVWIEYGTDYDDIDLVGGGLILENHYRWGLDASWRTYFEDLGPAGHDDLSIGDVGAFFRILQGNNASVRLGFSVPWVYYDGDLDGGASFTLGSDYFPLRPWILSTEADLGVVGHASLVHLRATLGFEIRHAELYTGVDYLSLDGEDLTAMVFGVRGWW